MKIKVSVASATGAVGKALVQAIIESDDLELVGAVSRQSQGKNLGPLIGKDDFSLAISSIDAIFR